MSWSAFVVGQCWTGSLPPGWTGRSAKRLFEQRKDRARAEDQQLSVTQSQGVVSQQELLENGQRVVLALSGIENFKHVDADDFVISLRSFQGGIERSTVSGCVSPAYTVLRAVDRINPRFWGYLFKSSAFITALRSVIDEGIRDGKSITYEQFGETAVPVPSVERQEEIADHLDRATTRIDTLVAKKTRFIELLREKRQALITHAVTKGLDPNAPMKDSGVEWLGRIPAHWDVGATRRFYSFNPSKREATLRPPYEEVSFLAMEAIGETGSLDLTRTRKIQEVETGYSYFANGDVVIAKITPCFENGKGAAVDNLVGGIGFGTTELIVLRPSRSVTQKYSWWLFASTGFRRFAEGHMEGSAGQKRVQDDWLKAQKVAIPPRPEQDAIVAHLDHTTARIDILIAKTERSIELLREHRTALITAAVTGKIDLRPAAA